MAIFSIKRSWLILFAGLGSAVAPAATYRVEGPLRAGVESFALIEGPKEAGGPAWSLLEAQKKDGRGSFRVWVQRNGQGEVERYIVAEGNAQAREYRHEVSGEAVLPSMVEWAVLWPQGSGERVEYLGHTYRRVAGAETWTAPPAARVVKLRPDLWLGPPSNRRQKDETRRYDTSDYEYVALARADYAAMAEAGITCVRADGEQQAWAEELGLFYWGPHEGLPYPELLYRSQYLGPALFLDEPAVSTRDYDLRPRLAKEPAYRKSMSPQEALRAYQAHYAKTISTGAPQVLGRTLAARADVDLGSLQLRQQNIYNWETMAPTAAWALGQDAHIPQSMVFEPPGRIGTRRTVPEFNMVYGTQFRVDDTRVLPGVVFGFLRGAARLNAKQWGVSIYGAVERADTFLWMTTAYDMGATRFHFWDNYQLACVPFGEILALSRHLRAHARQHPRPPLARLREAAERAILLPAGYDLGHVQMGRGNLWGIAELNLERVNAKGVKHRVVMSRLFGEIERALQQGVAFDLFWDLPGLKLAGYREVVRVREDGTVEGGGATPARAPGAGPELTVTVSKGRAVARVRETRAPVYYTLGADPAGVLHNAMVLWELFGPGEEDYLFLQAKGNRPVVRELSRGEAEVEIELPALAAGTYRLRAATVDTAGRSTVVWTEIRVN